MYLTVDVDAAAFTSRITAVLGIEGQVDYKTGQQRRDLNSNELLWSLEVVYRPEYGPKQVIEVGFGCQQPPQLVAGVMPTFEGLTVRPWAKVKDSGKLGGGQMFECRSVSFDQKPANASRPVKEAATAAA
jgi:hypothetical protein